MADPIRLTGCSTEGDLAGLAQSLLDQASIVRDDILSQISLLDPSSVSATISTLTSQYDTLIAPASNTDISTQIGLPTTQPGQQEEEERLQPLGLVMVRGILYAANGSGNIDRLRKLFFAVGSNIPLFTQLVNSTENLVVVQTRITVRSLPTSQISWTLAEARAVYQNDAIEQIYQAGDGVWYVIVPQFLAVNRSSVQVAFELQIPRNEIVTQVFWLRQVETNSARVNQLDNLGLDGVERSSILTDQPVKDVSPSSVELARTQSDLFVAKARQQIELFNSRFSTSTDQVKTTFRNEILLSVNEGRDSLYEVARRVRFSPTLIERPEDVNTFLVKNSSADLPYLFASRRSVSGINFQATTEELGDLIRTAAQIPSGSNTVSSILALTNQSAITLDLDINQTNLAMVLNQCARTKLQKTVGFKYVDLQTAYQCLSSIQIRPGARTIQTTPVVGYPASDSPASILFRRADLSVSLEVDNIFDRIVALADAVSAAVGSAIRVLISLLKSLRQEVNRVLSPLIEKVREEVAKIEAYLSRHASYFGTATVDSSILRCVLNLDLNATLPFFNDIAPFLETLQRTLRSLIAQIASIMQNFLNRLICLPITFLNDLLRGATSNLPNICKLDTFKLPEQLESALLELRDAFQVENVVYVNFSRNLLRLQASVTSLPAKVEAFRENIACNQTPLNSRFMTVFRKDVDLSIGTNPLGALANQLLPTRG